MSKPFKPSGYNSLSPYFVVKDAAKFMDLMKHVFDAKELRRYGNDDGTIMHAEMLVDDSVIMLADGNENYPPHKLMLHVYVSDVHRSYQRALEHGCQAVEAPVNKPGDPDIRGSFTDYAGNFWAIGTQL